jgi:hypothetical protein
MVRLACLPVVFGIVAMALGAPPAWAQTRATPTTEATTATPAPQAAPEPDVAQDATTAAAPGPVLFVLDSSRRIALVNVGSLRVKLIGRLGLPMTDIAFNPIDKKLYGISYNTLYRISTSDFSAVKVAGLGVNDANALVFDSAGTAYFAGYQRNRLYKLNLSTKRVTIVGLTGPYYSAGDLTFYNDRLVMSAVKTTNPNNSTANYLITLNPANAAVVGQPAVLGIHNVYGLASTGKNELYGLAVIGTSNKPALYQLFPAAASVPNRDTLLRNLSGTGLSLIVGTAYNGNFQP